MSTPLNLEQLRKQAKDLVRAGKAAGRPVKLADAQLELARRHGFASWPRLKSYVERLGAEQPFHTDIEYYEGRAFGIATVNGVTEAEARRDLAQRHGFPTWARLRRHVQELREGDEPPTPFILAYRAVEADDRDELAAASRRPSRARVRARHERQRPPRDGELARRHPAHARPRRRPEPRERLRLDEVPPGRVLELARPGPDDAGRRRAHRPLGARRRWHAAHRRPLLGAPRRRAAARP